MGDDEKDLDELQRLVADGLDFKSTYTQFVEETGHRDREEFVRYLLDKGLIDRRKLADVFDSRSVSLSGTESAILIRGDQRYEVFDQIGAGGMSVVRLARDIALKRRVALKTLKSDCRTPDKMLRFIREAQVTAQLDHPSIVPVYSLDRDAASESVSYAMKLIHGKTLEDFLTETRLILDRNPKRPLDAEHCLPARIERFIKVCEAVAYAHSRKVIHRDLKPSNIMFGNFGEVYVMDWGLAHLLTEDDAGSGSDFDLSEDRETKLEETRDGRIIGTPAFMSPEQAMGRTEKLDERSDQYSLGLILYELVTLREAIHGKDLADYLGKAARGHLPPITDLYRTIPIADELQAIIRKATSVNPLERYDSVQALADDLHRYLRGEEVRARPDGSLRKFERWVAGHQTSAMLALSCFVLTLVSIAVYSYVRSAYAVRTRQLRHEQSLRRFAQAAARAHEIDAHFVAFQFIAEQLASMCASLLTECAPGAEKVYADRDFDTPRGPDDVVFSPVYGRKVSLAYPAYRTAPGVNDSAVMPDLMRLSALRHMFRNLMRQGLHPHERSDTGGDRAILEDQGAPVRWMYVGLAEGVIMSYPGTNAFPEGYDPRDRPWYRLGERGAQARWGSPYVDLEGQGPVLPCSKGIRDAQGKLLGVAGVEIPFDWIIAHCLARRPGDDAVEAFLVDDQGRIVVRSGQMHAARDAGRIDGTLPLEPFPDPRVMAAVRDRRQGQVEGSDGGRPTITVFAAVPTLGWYYIEVSAAP